MVKLLIPTASRKFKMRKKSGQLTKFLIKCLNYLVVFQRKSRKFLNKNKKHSFKMEKGAIYIIYMNKF